MKRGTIDSSHYMAYTSENIKTFRVVLIGSQGFQVRNW